MNSFSWNSEREAHTVLPLFHKYWKHPEIFKHTRIHAHKYISGIWHWFPYKEQLKSHQIKRNCITHSLKIKKSSLHMQISSQNKMSKDISSKDGWLSKSHGCSCIFTSIRHPLCSIRINYILSKGLNVDLFQVSHCAYNKAIVILFESLSNFVFVFQICIQILLVR